MAKPKNKKGKRSKASVKVQDMKPTKNPKGGHAATGKHFSKVEITTR